MTTRLTCLLFVIASAGSLPAQPLGKPLSGEPGDEMIQSYLAHETNKLAAKFAEDTKSLEVWQAKRAEYLEQYYYMLGLSPRPEKTPLNATVTGTLKGDGYEVDLIHYQSRPGLYVTGNLYRPAKIKEGEKLPAVFYVCGHSGRGRNGNKVAYQSHGLWFARHGYVCLVVDTLQLGEIAATHHGTYNLERWWWHSRGYTPAGVEAWNGVRGIDYLISRPDVDPERIAVTGISGGGAATFWVAAADERVKVAVPVSGMADLESYVPNRVINGHCDCMFMVNTFQWPWTRIAGLVAPRPMLFINSDKDPIFPMDANERITTRLERLYSLYGASGDVDTVVSVGGHAYRQDIRQAAYRFINVHLKGDGAPITDSEIDIVSEGSNPGPYPIPPEKLRVFPTDDDLPKDQLNTKIDEHFVPLAKVSPPEKGKFEEWKAPLLKELRRVVFRSIDGDLPAPKSVGGDPGVFNARFQYPDGLQFQFNIAAFAKKDEVKNGLFVVTDADEWIAPAPKWAKTIAGDRGIVLCETRGTGTVKWTTKGPPNYVARSHVLLGTTVDTGRVRDVLEAVKSIRTKEPEIRINVAGKGAAGLIGAYAAVLDNKIDTVTLASPPVSHMEKGAPQFLNVLRVCDVPDALGLIAPRSLTLVGVKPEDFARTKAAYEAAGAGDKLTFQ